MSIPDKIILTRDQEQRLQNGEAIVIAITYPERAKYQVQRDPQNASLFRIINLAAVVPNEPLAKTWTHIAYQLPVHTPDRAPEICLATIEKEEIRPTFSSASPVFFPTPESEIYLRKQATPANKLMQNSWLIWRPVSAVSRFNTPQTILPIPEWLPHAASFASLKKTGSLESILATVSLETLIEAFEVLALNLQKLHQQDRIHGSLVLPNLFIQTSGNGNDPVFYLCFLPGIELPVTGEPKKWPVFWQLDSPFGHEYAAPEYQTELSPASDIYQLGRLLSGFLLYFPERDSTSLQQFCSDKMTAIQPEKRSDIDTVIEKLQQFKLNLSKSCPAKQATSSPTSASLSASTASISSTSSSNVISKPLPTLTIPPGYTQAEYSVMLKGLLAWQNQQPKRYPRRLPSLNVAKSISVPSSPAAPQQKEEPRSFSFGSSRVNKSPLGKPPGYK